MRGNAITSLIVSSLKVYGTLYTGKPYIEEDDNGYVDFTSYKSCYAIGKRAAETLAASYSKQYGMNIRDLNNVYAAFADEVKKQGYLPMLYSSKNFLDTIWSERTKHASPVWLAHYVDETNYTGEYAIWQASAYGRIPGIDGDVDMNIQYLNQPIE